MDPKEKISTYFTWGDALLLPQYRRLADESDGVTDEIKANLKILFDKLDQVREYFNSPILVHVAYRSPDYNKLVGGAGHSAHLFGKAVDFHVIGVDCDAARTKLLKDNMLETMQMRMEDNPGSSWIHLDTAPVPAGGHRFFPV